MSLVVQAIILGVVQGLTEFIPVSSSGHLILVPHILNTEHFGKQFDVAVHMGTLLALVIFYRKDWVYIIKDFWATKINKKNIKIEAESDVSGKILIPILVGCIPAAFVGYMWEDIIDNTLSQWHLTAIMLVIIGFVMLFADKIGKKERGIKDLNYTDFITIGCAQALALFPGVSRSGITISAGLFRNIDRAAAARFSFLLSMPITLGAGMLKAKGIIENGIAPEMVMPYIAGIISAGISGYFAIAFLLNYLKKKSLNLFVYYRFALAGIAFLIFFIRQ
ncbi:MAG: undecaprenyl-diphosphatase UppP [Armatimonadota bacterium]